MVEVVATVHDMYIGVLSDIETRVILLCVGVWVCVRACVRVCVCEFVFVSVS